MQRELRLTNRNDFTRIYKYGKSVANRQFVVYFMSQPAIEQFRLGVSVSKKIGNAVIRNRLRRMIKEVVRLHAEKIRKQTDMIIIARNPAAAMSYREIEKSIIHVLKLAGIFSKK